MQSLAVRYRPTRFSEVSEQKNIIAILENQIKTKSWKNAYLFCGPAGCGKTTMARIVANEINEGQGTPIEIDAASNNSIDNIRQIRDDARFKSLNSEYKVYILDEAHGLSSSALEALLKILEEPPEKTVFILCTTEAQKIKSTILSRCQRFDFHRLSYDAIIGRLKDIIQAERKSKVKKEELEALSYIAKTSEGGLRTAISALDKCLSFSDKLTLKNVIEALGNIEYDILFKFIQSILQKEAKESILIIEEIYRVGVDLKVFVKQLQYFLVDMLKFNLFRDYEYLYIPGTINLESLTQNDFKALQWILDEVVKLNNEIKYSPIPKLMIESYILKWTRGD